MPIYFALLPPSPPTRITISNFRSFRQQPEIHPFSPATNAVVGRNGSGKSNLFDAVQFCLLLSPRFHTLRTVSFFGCCAVLWTCNCYVLGPPNEGKRWRYKRSTFILRVFMGRRRYLWAVGVSDSNTCDGWTVSGLAFLWQLERISYARVIGDAGAEAMPRGWLKGIGITGAALRRGTRGAVARLCTSRGGGVTGRRIRTSSRAALDASKGISLIRHACYLTP